MIRLDRVSWIVTPTSGPDGDEKVRVSNEEDHENWHVQVRRKRLPYMVVHDLIVQLINSFKKNCPQF